MGGCVRGARGGHTGDGDAVESGGVVRLSVLVSVWVVSFWYSTFCVIRVVSYLLCVVCVVYCVVCSVCCVCHAVTCVVYFCVCSAFCVRCAVVCVVCVCVECVVVKSVLLFGE